MKKNNLEKNVCVLITALLHELFFYCMDLIQGRLLTEFETIVAIKFSLCISCGYI